MLRQLFPDPDPDPDPDPAMVRRVLDLDVEEDGELGAEEVGEQS
jgi:hypothetical protein